MKRIILFLFLLGSLPVAGRALMLDTEAIKVKLPAGQEFVRTVVVTNDSAESLPLTLEPEPWVYHERSADMTDWLSLTPKKFQLLPHVRQYVEVRGKVPTALTGECLVMLYFTSVKYGPEITLHSRLGLPIYICRAGTEVQQAQVQAFRFLPRTPHQAVNVELQLLNSGNVHLVPFGAVILKRKGAVLGQANVKFDRPIFPRQVGTQQFSFPADRFTSGDYQAELQVVLGDLYDHPVGMDYKVLSAQCALSIP